MSNPMHEKFEQYFSSLPHDILGGSTATNLVEIDELFKTFLAGLDGKPISDVPLPYEALIIPLNQKSNLREALQRIVLN
jgi:hypothetical protein